MNIFARIDSIEKVLLTVVFNEWILTSYKNSFESNKVSRSEASRDKSRIIPDTHPGRDVEIIIICVLSGFSERRYDIDQFEATKYAWA
ncbi:unnamed protein product [Leptosia nina]|uniref:Uncharacterized protein n=1 Tax=Leptosia nina TaxID=320188 RepID=A0AAV1JH91_9NEOP